MLARRLSGSALWYVKNFQRSQVKGIELVGTKSCGTFGVLKIQICIIEQVESFDYLTLIGGRT